MGCQAACDLRRRRCWQPLLLEDQREFGHLALGFIFDLLALMGDLGPIQALFSLACKVRPAAHRNGPGDGLGDARHEDHRAPRIGRGHAADNTERNEKTVLETQHQLANPATTGDPLRFRLDVFANVLAGEHAHVRPKLRTPGRGGLELLEVRRIPCRRVYSASSAPRRLLLASELLSEVTTSGRLG